MRDFVSADNVRDLFTAVSGQQCDSQLTVNVAGESVASAAPCSDLSCEGVRGGDRGAGFAWPGQHDYAGVKVDLVVDLIDNVEDKVRNAYS